ncbi:hypothetical protein KUV80_16285 [Fictibacillus nanhaiensis]|uniref:hypothetical protein n=1 Tax=Fictibacillus nanhaiensis TaxID=742169 RepID=UPI001C95F59B|nr:hypothetical protein [Fictibacillus nanhaiensis]MBY6038220.1 hypothetical protein [Fictibacillus nanhaiensis]
MIWLILFSPVAAALLLFVFINWRTKRKYRKYNLKYNQDQNLSDNNKINQAAAWTNAARHNHHSGGGGGGGS